MLTQANQVSYKKVEIKESTASTIFYGLILIPWYYVAVITFRNLNILHNNRDHHFKILLLQLTLLGLIVALAAIIIKFSVAAKSRRNNTQGPRTFWEPRLLRIKVSIMRSPY